MSSFARELHEQAFEFCELIFQSVETGVFRFQLSFQFLVQSLDGRQSDTVRIDCRNVALVGAEAEGCVKILRHRADVRRGGIAFKVPTADRQPGHFLQNFTRTHGREVLFQVTIAGRIEHGCGYRADHLQGAGGIILA